MNCQKLRSTNPDRTVAGVRIFLGILFLMTGLMKLFIPMLADAFVGQLAAVDMPLQELNRWLVPIVEVAVGGTLLRGFHTRLSAAVVLGLMTVAMYVHLVVEDPALFPLQPTAPIIPGVVIVLALFLLVWGGGTGSMDLKSMETLAD
jgi:uncharacterized membrane protein YphA (DoxX/SURF4 family)